MQDLPHEYHVEGTGQAEGVVVLDSEGVPSLETAPPAQFGGPGDRWSPETLLVGAVVDCFILTFRAVARASSVDWAELRCSGRGELDRVDRVTRFTAIHLDVHLTIPEQTDAKKAEALLRKSERSCLISQSLVCPVELTVHVRAT